MTMHDDYHRWFAVQTRALGPQAQRTLRKACVAVIGVGGAGSMVAGTLASAGIGALTLIDPQSVTADNLNRLAFARPGDIGRPKVQVLERALRQRPHLMVTAVKAAAADDVIEDVLASAGLIVSASNTVASRLVAARYAVKHRRAHVGVGVGDAREGLAGTVSLWSPGRPELACHGCFVEGHAEAHRDVLLGSVTAFAGLIAAHAAIMLLASGTARIVHADVNFLTFDLVRYRMDGMLVKRRPSCGVCGSRQYSPDGSA